MEDYCKWEINPNSETIFLRREYIKELLEYEGRNLVGKIMKRRETIGDSDLLFSQIKELVYEEMRNLEMLLLAGGLGAEKSIFKFKSKGKPSTH